MLNSFFLIFFRVLETYTGKVSSVGVDFSNDRWWQKKSMGSWDDSKTMKTTQRSSRRRLGGMLACHEWISTSSPRSQLKRHANICQPCPEIVQRNTDHLILVLHFSHFTALFVPFCARGWSFNIHWCGTWGVAGWTVKVLQRCVSFNTLKLQRNY